MTQEETHGLPSSLSETRSHQVGKAFTPKNLILRNDISQLTETEHLNGLIANRDWILDATPQDCFSKGLTISKALRIDRAQTKILLFAEMKRLWRSVRIGNGKTWNTDEDLQDAVDDIVDIFRTLKIEEIQYCLKSIRRGEHKLYGRLDTPTIIEILRKYDTDVSCAYRESGARQNDGASIPKGMLTEFAKTLPIRMLSMEEAIKRGSKISPEEKKAMHERDKARNIKVEG